MPERCAGALVVRPDRRDLLMIRTRARRFELPKGHLEPGESDEEAALRELAEETALLAALDPRGPFATVDYRFEGAAGPVAKRVVLHLFFCRDARFGPLPRGIRERRWCGREEVVSLPLRSDNLRPILLAALDTWRR